MQTHGLFTQSRSKYKYDFSFKPTPEFSDVKTKEPDLDSIVYSVRWADTAMSGILMKVWPGVTHEFILLELGRISTKKIQRIFTSDEIEAEHSFMVLDLSGFYNEIEGRIHGVISVFEVIVKASVDESNGSELTDKVLKEISKSCKLHNYLGSKDIPNGLTARHVCGVAMNIAEDGYDLV